MVLPAFAGDLDYAKGTDPDHPAEAAITKIFKMGLNTPNPDAIFTFTFDKVGFYDDDSTAVLADMPEIASVTIEFAKGDNTLYYEEVDDTRYYVKQSTNFLAGLVSDDWANGEGIYNYQVQETKSGIILEGAENEGYVYSDAYYDVEIWVENYVDEDGLLTGILYPKFVVVRIVENHVDEYYEGSDGGEKVDPTPGTTVEFDEYEVIQGDISKFIFTNKYWRSDGDGEDPDPDPDHAALLVTKEIIGTSEDMEKEFAFTVKVTQPRVVNETKTFIAYILDEEGENVTADRYTGYVLDSLDNPCIKFTSGTEIPGIMLTHNDQLIFVDLIIGSKVEVKENPTNDFKSSYRRLFPTDQSFTGKNGEVFGFGFGLTHDPGPHYTNAGKTNNNKAFFTNTRAIATPTGISVDNLPFFVMIGAALAGLAGFVVVRSRKYAEYEA
jgi:hypothetical protein